MWSGRRMREGKWRRREEESRAKWRGEERQRAKIDKKKRMLDRRIKDAYGNCDKLRNKERGIEKL